MLKLKAPWNTILSVALLTSFFSSPLKADYGWIPKYQTLNLRLGADYYKSEENFADDGERTNYTFNSRNVSLSQYSLFIEPEYGFAEDWAAIARISVLNAFLDPLSSNADSLLSTFSLGDFRLATKWNLLKGNPLFTLETFFKVPLYSGSFNATDLAAGDANFDMGFIFHGGAKYKNFFFALSPGLSFRFSGYSNQFLLDSALGYSQKWFALRLFSNLSTSFTKLDQTTPSTTTNTALGSGGSFSRLSKHADLFSLGLRGTINFYKKQRLELSVSRSLFGNEAHDFIKFGVSYFTHFDFYEEEKKIKVREVPFDKEEEN